MLYFCTNEILSEWFISVGKQSRQVRICSKVPPSSSKRSFCGGSHTYSLVNGSFAVQWLVIRSWGSCNSLFSGWEGEYDAFKNFFLFYLTQYFVRKWTWLQSFQWEEQFDEEGKNGFSEEVILFCAVMLIRKNSLVSLLSDFYYSSLVHSHRSAFYMPFKIVGLGINETTTTDTNSRTKE